METDLATTVRQLAEAARAASLKLAVATTEAKNRALTALAEKIESSIPALIAANARDLEAGRAAGLSAALLDRLTLNESRIRQMAQGVREIVALADPVGAELERTTRPNGLVIRKVRVPIGVIGIIYESRPNVTVDCAALCLKAGDATILRGGKEAFHSNTALAALISESLAVAGLPATAVQLIPTTDRAALNTLLKLNELVHCIIPRGGEALIRFVTENSSIPVIKHYKGVCFIYVDRAADLALAEPLLVNAKVQRPSACNAAEQLLVHRDIAATALPRLAKTLQTARTGGVELRCDAESAAILAAAGIATKPATAEDYRTEFLDYVLCVRVVDSLDAAIATINRDSSNHSDAIVTADESAARRFQGEVDSATVYWNASTRFTDGFEFGLGAEIGISTDRLHARGPMGLAELCSYKFVIDGTGQIRR
jgi:glutamate-5-semialdehyde dehydrogenase